MSNILIHMLVDAHSEYDIFSPTDYAAMVQAFRTRNGSCPNLGNRLWFQGLVSELSGPENTLTYFREDMTKDYINETFDMIVAPMANVFHVAFSGLLQHLAGRFHGIRIPVYVIACGVQADSYDGLDQLCAAIGKPARAFMKSVYDTGGEFALRGYFSKEFFDRMGFSTAVVTGCPSLYQLGRQLQLPDEKVDRVAFRPLLNGNFEEYLPLGKEWPNTEFFDQERFFYILHDSQSNLEIRKLVHYFGFETTRWLLEQRVRLIPNMNDWRNYLMEGGFSFSFGSRIHGSIMPILAGIPALMEPRDARTREMAEFFEIPTVAQKKSLYDMYLETDYSSYNKNFGEKFDAYERFLKDRGIVESINIRNGFFREAPVDAALGNQQQLKQLHKPFRAQQWLWKGYDAALQYKRKRSGRE